jgi:hypothetical protein
MTGQQDSQHPWGSEPADGDIVEQGRDGRGPDWPGRSWARPRWWPPLGPGGRLGRAGKLTVALVVAALVLGVAGGYLGGYQAGDTHGRSQAPKPRQSSSAQTMSSFGLAETGSQCSSAQGRTLEVGVEVVNGSPEAMRLGALTATFPRGGIVKITRATWGPCDSFSYPSSPHGGLLPAGASIWMSVTVTTAGECPGGLPVQYVASFDQGGQTYTVALPGFVDLGGLRDKGCPAS